MNRPRTVETFQTYLQRHIANRTGHPQRQHLLGAAGDRAYKKELRERLGVGDSTFRRWLNGDTVPWPSDAARIAAALGLVGASLESESKVLMSILRVEHGEDE